MNDAFADIADLFSLADIKNFEKLPDDTVMVLLVMTMLWLCSINLSISDLDAIVSPTETAWAQLVVPSPDGLFTFPSMLTVRKPS